ncbi:MAG: GGDEF domain-containing protein [Treponema sp.]|nr:GGDEF domain-containing protein [Treponema sp.]MBR4463097.1 GGDEF domain-containing protein [Treponema sp.]
MENNQSSDELSLEEKVSLYEKKIYDLQQLLDISRSLCSTVDFSTLIESILYTCMGQMRVLSAGIFILNALDSNSYMLDTNYSGLDLNPNISYKIPASHPIVHFLNSLGQPCTLEEAKKQLPAGSDIRMLSSLRPSLLVPLIQKNHLDGILVLGERLDLGNDFEYTADDKDQILMIGSLAAIAINNAALVERSSTDMMTHLKLKYFFYNVLTNKLDAARTDNLPLAVIMFDIDFFKRFNDTYGHACGDYVLITVAKIIKSSIRAEDLAGRYGGEEFTVMLNNTCKEDAITVADRIRSKVEQYDFCYENQHVKVTISIGVAEYDSKKNPVTSPKELVDQADQALYVSKRGGRNRVTFADPQLIAEIKVSE